MKKTLLPTLLILLFTFQANAQDAWKKLMLKGKISYHSYTTTKNFDYEANIVTKSESELTGSTDQVLTFFPGRFQLMAKDPKKLKEFNEANIHHIFFGETYDSDKSKPILFPVEFVSVFKEWGKCDDKGEFRLIKNSNASGVSHVTSAKTHLTMIQTRSQEEVDEDKMWTEGLNKFAQQVMEVRRENDIKAGKKINEDDYFIPRGLHNKHTFGLFLFTNWWSTDFQNLPVIRKYRDYDCETKEWKESTAGKGVDLQISDNNRVLMESYNEDTSVGRFQYIGISPEQMDTFIKNPKVPATFITIEHRYTKDASEERETKTIITLTVAEQ